MREEHGMALNASWHANNPMPKPATLEQQVKWHVAHAKACGCRDIPRTVAAELERRRRAARRR
jgi:hypothetical protein